MKSQTWFAYKRKPQSIDTHALGTARENNGNVVVLAASFRLKTNMKKKFVARIMLVS